MRRSTALLTLFATVTATSACAPMNRGGRIGLATFGAMLAGGGALVASSHSSSPEGEDGLDVCGDCANILAGTLIVSVGAGLLIGALFADSPAEPPPPTAAAARIAAPPMTAPTRPSTGVR